MKFAKGRSRGELISPHPTGFGLVSLERCGSQSAYLESLQPLFDCRLDLACETDVLDNDRLRAKICDFRGVSALDPAFSNAESARAHRRRGPRELQAGVPRSLQAPPACRLNACRLIDRRFSNPAIKDITRRVAFDGSARHTGFVLPILQDGLASNTPAPSSPIEGLALVEALWARMCEGTRENGTTIEPNDPIWPDLTRAAKAARTRPRAWLDQHHLYGDLATTPRFAEPFERWLTQIWTEGCEATLRAYLGR